MTNIEKLLKKYDDIYIEGIYESPEQQHQRKQKQRIQKRLQLFEDLLFEEPSLYLNKYEKERVQYHIRKYTNFKELCKNAKEETIILAFIFYVKSLSNPDIRLDRWGICKEYGLTERIGRLIVSNLREIDLKEKPLPLSETTRYDHSILEKQAL